MENSLYALLLAATVAYESRVVERPTAGSAARLGALLGLTALARLNAVLLIPCLIVSFVARRAHDRLAVRLRLGALAATVAVLIVVPYFAANYAASGHLFPVSGAVKSVAADAYLAGRGVDSRFSPQFVTTVYGQYHRWLGWFVLSRASDGMWIAGARLVTDEAIPPATMLAVLVVVGIVPLLAGSVRGWVTFLRRRFASLAPFAYLLVFGALDTTVSILLYPTEIPYAIIRWWLVEDEIIIVVLVATFVVASIGYVAQQWIPRVAHVGLATGALAALVGLSAVQWTTFYWNGTVESRDWNRSFGDSMYDAARWLEANVPHDALVGSWNAGVLGYYAKQRVVNLDGLINSYDLLPYLKQRRIVDYIEKERIAYLSDAEGYFTDHEPTVLRELRLRKVYSRKLESLKDQTCSE